MGAQVVALWDLPDIVVAAIRAMGCIRSRGRARRMCNIVNLAHRLTDCTLQRRIAARAGPPARRSGLQGSGFRARGCGARCSIAAGAIGAELDSYLRPRLAAAPLSMRRRLDYRVSMKNNTRVNHPPPVDLPADNRALVAPIYQSVKFSFDDTAETLRYLRGEREGFFYSRSSNPTLRQLELLLAHLQGRDDCLLTGSGVATIAAACCPCASRAITCSRSSNPTVRPAISCSTCWRDTASPTLCCRSRIAPASSASSTTAARARSCSRVPTNPVTKIADLEHLTDHARRAGALTVLDNTFAGFHNHGGFDDRHFPAQPDQVRLGPRRCDGRRDHRRAAI